MIKTLEQLGYERTEYFDEDGIMYAVDFRKDDNTGTQRINISLSFNEIEAYTVNKNGRIDIEIFDFETIKAIDKEIQEIETYKESL